MKRPQNTLRICLFAITALVVVAPPAMSQSEITQTVGTPPYVQAPVDRPWETLDAEGEPTARHEAALVTFEEKLFLIGGRRVNPVDIFDPRTNRWTARSPTPLEMHHFQAVVLDDAIYLIGAMTGRFPNETPLERVVKYLPESDEFQFEHGIPVDRRRGGAGAAVYDEKIYLVGGITDGHNGGFKPWFDEYDPSTGQWRILADAPNSRDHFQAVVLNDRLYAVGGRQTSHSTGKLFDNTIAQVDVYDFKTNAWLPSEDCPVLPTPRAGNMVMTHGDWIVVGGGESLRKTAHDEVEAFDTITKQWATWPSLVRGRHGSGFAIIGDHVYTASGSGNRGGGPELKSVERLPLAK